MKLSATFQTKVCASYFSAYHHRPYWLIVNFLKHNWWLLIKERTEWVLIWELRTLQPDQGTLYNLWVHLFTWHSLNVWSYLIIIWFCYLLILSNKINILLFILKAICFKQNCVNSRGSRGSGPPQCAPWVSRTLECHCNATYQGFSEYRPGSAPGHDKLLTRSPLNK